MLNIILYTCMKSLLVSLQVTIWPFDYAWVNGFHSTSFEPFNGLPNPYPGSCMQPNLRLTIWLSLVEWIPFDSIPSIRLPLQTPSWAMHATKSTFDHFYTYAVHCIAAYSLLKTPNRTNGMIWTIRKYNFPLDSIRRCWTSTWHC